MTSIRLNSKFHPSSNSIPSSSIQNWKKDQGGRNATDWFISGRYRSRSYCSPSTRWHANYSIFVCPALSISTIIGLLWLWHWPSPFTSEWTPFKSLSTNARPASCAFSEVIKLTKNLNLITQPTWLRARLYRLIETLTIKPIKIPQLQITLNNASLCRLKFQTWPFPNYSSPAPESSQWWRCCLCLVQCWGKLLLKVMPYNIVLLPKKVTNYVTFYEK